MLYSSLMDSRIFDFVVTNPMQISQLNNPIDISFLLLIIRFN